MRRPNLSLVRRRSEAPQLCPVCLRRRRLVGSSICGRCRNARVERDATRYERLRAAGLCTRSGCGEPADGYLCEAHAAQRRAARSS